MQTTPDQPLWVSLGLANISTRKGALTLFLICLACAIACIPLAYYRWISWIDWSWAAVMFPCALWYWLCIRWMDNNAGWPNA